MGRDLATRLTVCAALVVSVLGPRDAYAGAGDHIRAGDAEIVPSLELFTVYRTNVYLAEGATTDVEGNPVGAGAQSGTSLRVHPAVSLAAKGNDAIFNFGVDYNAVTYFEKIHKNLNRYKDVEVGMNLNAFHQSPVGIKLNDRFHITGRETEATYATTAYINHLMNDAGGRISIHPGSALEVDLGGNFTYDKYDVSANTTVEGNPALNSRLGYGPGVDVKWNFFPKTAIVASYSMAWFDWDQNLLNAEGDGISTEDVGARLGVPDGNLWRATLGLRGRFTDKLILGLIGGYGRMNYDESSVIAEGGGEEVGGDEGFAEDLISPQDGFLAVAELGYHPIESQTITLGYRKAFQDVYFTNYVTFHNAFLRYEGLFAERFGTTLEAGYRYETYKGEVAREDHMVHTSFDFVVHATAFLDVGTGVTWRQRGSADGAHPEIEYDDIAIRGGVTLTY
jgi:hypothetical protein